MYRGRSCVGRGTLCSGTMGPNGTWRMQLDANWLPLLYASWSRPPTLRQCLLLTSEYERIICVSSYVCKNYILMMRNRNVFYSGPVRGVSYIVCMQPGQQAKRHDAENGQQQGSSGETLWWAEEGERDWHRYKSNPIQYNTRHNITYSRY